jgi:hypothetical protein
MSRTETSCQRQTVTALPITPGKGSETMSKARDDDFYKRVRDDFMLQSASYLQVTIKGMQPDLFHVENNTRYFSQ